MEKQLKQIRYNRENKDYDIFIKGRYIGSARNIVEAEQKAQEQINREIKFQQLHQPVD